MSTPQRIARFLLPSSWFDRMRESSERWMIRCTRCKSERSVWSVGGIRYGAASAGKRIAVRCTTCDDLVAAQMYYRDDEAAVKG